MKIKQRTQAELDHLRSSWKIGEDGVIVWIRKANGGKNIGDPVGLSTKRSGHQTCNLFVNGKGYGYATGQVAWFLHHGEWPQQEIDHIDGDPQNNRKDNLRYATRSQQSLNRRYGHWGRKNKGVYKRPYGDRWTAQIWFNGKYTGLGTFGTEEEAVEARKKATLELHGEFANLHSYA